MHILVRTLVRKLTKKRTLYCGFVSQLYLYYYRIKFINIPVYHLQTCYIYEFNYFVEHKKPYVHCQTSYMNIWLLMCVLMVILIEQKFHVMQKSVPREDFIRLSPAAPDAIHELVFSIQQKGLSELEHMLTDRSTPGNTFYQQWLSYDQIGEITSNLESAQEIKQWLTSNGATITWISTNSHYIKAEAQISLWESLLNTKFSLWEDRSRMKNKNKI